MAHNLFIFNSKLKISKSLIQIIIALLTFIVLNMMIVKIGPYFDSNYATMENVNDESWIKGGDYLFLGDSRGHQGLVPAEFSAAMKQHGQDVSAINLARPGMQIPFAYYFSKRVTENATTPPKAVIVNFSFYLLGGMQWMKDIYFSYYRPSLSEAYHSCISMLQTCSDAAIWYAKTRIPAWMFRKRANDFLKRTLIGSPQSLLGQLNGMYEIKQLLDFDVAQGYLNRGASHIDSSDIQPHGYGLNIDNGYSIYYKYLDLMLTELAAKNIDVYVYRFPWPEARQNEEGFQEVLDHYWSKIKTGNREGSSIHFLDDVYFWPNEYFVDPLHLNHAGATRLTKTIAEKISETQ
ncbi:hypothetical protein FMZ60_00570 [Alcaligenaceae bacterium SJ-26]|nr:hypothetical protein FMZ60_00570 [Alcaligenaceae bacterium SJ-26]